MGKVLGHRSLSRSVVPIDHPIMENNSILTFYIKRACKGLSEDHRKVLEHAKEELHILKS